MASVLRLTVQLQQLAVRLSGLVLSGLLGAYLVHDAARLRPEAVSADTFLSGVTAVLGLVLCASLWFHGQLYINERARLSRMRADLGFFSGWVVASYALINSAPGGLDGALYPLIYVTMMASAAYARPGAAALVMVFACVLEWGLRAAGLEPMRWEHLAPRLMFLLVFTSLNMLLFRAEVRRVRKVSRAHVADELARFKDAARNYRLASAGKPPGGAVLQSSDDQALHSAVEEMAQSAKFALQLLKHSLDLDSVALLSADAKGQLTVFESLSAAALADRPLAMNDGIFGVALDRKEPIGVAGKRAAHHAPFFVEPQQIGALAVAPILENSQARAFLFAVRAQAREFAAHELKLLFDSGAFLLRAMQNERVFARLDRANREQAKLYRAASALGAARTEAQVIEVSVECAREVAAFDFAAVTLFHKKGGVHEICAVSGEAADHLLGRTFRQNAGLVAMAVANRHALPYKGNYEPSCQVVFSRGHEPPPMPSLLVLPLLVHERVLGTLVLGSHEKNAFSQSVRPALEMLASHMAVSLSSARLLKRLEEQATTDGMTGLLNKRTLIAEAERRLKIATRFNKPLSLLVTDIDHFKKVNDTYGHDVGDVVIKGLGDVLRRIQRDTDLVGRFGGEEFVVVCEQTDEEGAMNLAERIRKELAATTFQTELGPLSVTCSVGVAPFPSAGRDWESLFKATDEALYVSKRNGRNRVTVYRPHLKSGAQKVS